jgi:hypothetical protein
MPATTDAEVFNFEGNIEKAFSDYLTANGVSVATSNSPVTTGDDYVSVTADIGGIFADEHMTAKQDGTLEYDHYNFTVEVKVHTDRDENSTPSAGFLRSHKEQVAKLRQLLSISRAYKAGSLSTYLTYYSINRLIPSGTAYESDDMHYDATILSFAGDFSILTSAWPSV